MKIILCVVLLFSTPTDAQDSTLTKANLLSYSGYIETYYSYDFNKPADNYRPAFFYNHSRHNEFNLNLGFVKASYEAKRIRGNIAIAAGTYINANYASEPGTLKNILEANAGFKISKKNLWLEAGIFPSHIGFESATGKDNGTLTRSLLAENSPYYEAGAKLTYITTGKKWLLSILALNGWQRITRIDGNSLMSFGSQVTYKAGSNVTINYSNFIGTDKPDSVRQMRYFHNFYGIFPLGKKGILTAGFDIGAEEQINAASKMATWYSALLIAKFNINHKWALAARGEYYHDRSGVIIPLITRNGISQGFNTTGFSINADYAPAANMLLRVEARSLVSKDEIFLKASDLTNSNSFITMAFAFSF